MVQLLRFLASNAGGMGSIFGQGTKITHAAWYDQKKKGAEKVQVECVVCLHFYEKKKKNNKICFKIFFYTFKDRKVNYTSVLLFSH